MPLTDDIIRRLAATPYGRSQLDTILSANPQLNSPLIQRGALSPEPAETGVPTRPRPLLTTPFQATAPSAPAVATPPADALQGYMPEMKTQDPEPADGGGLWDRVKHFFEPDETDSYDQDVSSRAWGGAAAAAAQAASDWRASPVQVLTNALAGYSTAKGRAKEDMRTRAREDRILDLKERGLEAEAAELESKQAQRQQLMEEINGIENPEERRLAMLDPGAYAAARVKQLFAEDEPFTLGAGQTRYGPGGEVLAAVPAEVKPLTLDEGQIAYDQAGNIIARGPNKTFGPQAPITLSEGQVAYDRAGNIIASGPPKTPGKELPIVQLQAYRDSLPPGQARDEVQAQITKLNAVGGGEDVELTKLYAAMDRETNPERKAGYQAKINTLLKGRGGIRFTQGDTSFEIGGEGGGGVMDLSQPNLNKTQESVIGSQDQLARISEIGNQFDPKFMERGPRIGAVVTSELEKLGVPPSPEAQQQLSELTTFRSNVMNNLNLSIKEQSGLTMNESEAQRLQQEVPSDSDSATQFVAKLKATKQRLQSAVIRKKLLLAQGIQFDPNNPSVTLDNVPSAINAMGTKIEQDLVASGVPAAEAKRQAAAQLKQKLGL